MVTPTALDPDAVPPATGREAGRGRDGLYDAIKAIAIVRVLAWHTWSWSWLSWIAAMPAMFFSSGVLLGGSLQRSGYRRVVPGRLRRLLVPFGLYAACSVAAMVAGGWRPELRELGPWVLPVWDPQGPEDFAPLWVPLWYLRAYLWFLVSSVLLWRVAALGWLAPALAAGLTLAVARAGLDLPMAVGDYVAYLPFVLAGLVVARKGLPRRPLAAAVAGAAAVVAVAALLSGGLPDIANESYAATLVAGVAGVGLALALRSPLRSLAGSGAGGAIAWIGSRALTIYLWQGFGLLAADRFVWSTDLPGPLKALLAGLTVFGVTFALVLAVGVVEDWAARKALRLPRLALVPLCVAALAVAVLAVAEPRDPADDRPILLSGVAVLAGAEEVDEHLDAGGGSEALAAPGSLEGTGPGLAATTEAVTAVLEQWTVENAGLLDDLGTNTISIGLATPDGTTAVRWTRGSGAAPAASLGASTDFGWFSMTKAATTGWMLRLSEQGLLSIDDPLSTYLPDIPRGDEITLEMLARHQAGIPPEADTPGVLPDVGADVRAWVTEGTFAFAPGEGYSYSRLGYTLLAWALEEAAGTSWRQGIEGLADEAGVSLAFDEDLLPPDAPSHHPDPDGPPYRGGYWGAGALRGTPDEGAAFYRWLLTDGLSPASFAEMTAFDPRRERGYYGLGVVPSCPCSEGGLRLEAEGVGHGTVTGWWTYDSASTNTVMVMPDVFWGESGQAPEWSDLDAALIQAARG